MKQFPLISPSMQRRLPRRQDKPFQPVGGIVDLLGTDYFPVSENKIMTEIAMAPRKPTEPASAAAAAPAPS